MKEIITTITQRGQVTIPAEVRRILGAKPRDKVVFRIDDSEVRIAPVKFTLETAYGSVTPLNQPEDFKAISQAAKEEQVEKTVRKMQRR